MEDEKEEEEDSSRRIAACCGIVAFRPEAELVTELPSGLTEAGEETLMLNANEAEWGGDVWFEVAEFDGAKLPTGVLCFIFIFFFCCVFLFEILLAFFVVVVVAVKKKNFYVDSVRFVFVCANEYINVDFCFFFFLTKSYFNL